MIFKDKLHKDFYAENILKTNSVHDPYRQALFYTLGLTRETRKYIHGLYDFREKGIDFDGLSKAWQTSGTMRVTRLAFNLYNNFNGQIYDEGTGTQAAIDGSGHYTPEDIFCDGLMPYFFEAVKLRYPENCYEISKGDSSAALFDGESAANAADGWDEEYED